jgi:hypothetical protein
LIRRAALHEIGVISSSGAAPLEMVRKLKAIGASFAEVEVTHYPRLHGRSQFFTLASLARTFYDFGSLLVHAWLSAFASAPPPPPAKEEVKEPLTSNMLTLSE